MPILSILRIRKKRKFTTTTFQSRQTALHITLHSEHMASKINVSKSANWCLSCMWTKTVLFFKDITQDHKMLDDGDYDLA